MMQIILPWLLARRAGKAREVIRAHNEQVARRLVKADALQYKRNEMLRLRAQGLTHKAIADQLGYERTTVTKALAALSK